MGLIELATPVVITIVTTLCVALVNWIISKTAKVNFLSIALLRPAKNLLKAAIRPLVLEILIERNSPQLLTSRTDNLPQASSFFQGDWQLFYNSATGGGLRSNGVNMLNYEKFVVSNENVYSVLNNSLFQAQYKLTIKNVDDRKGTVRLLKSTLEGHKLQEETIAIVIPELMVGHFLTYDGFGNLSFGGILIYCKSNPL